MYIVLTADVVDSKKNPRKTEDRLKLLDTFKMEGMLTQFKPLKGDEIQGVLQDTKRLPFFLRTLRYLILPLKLRVGIGFGEIDINLDSKNPWEMNGQAFHRARESLIKLKREKKSSTFFSTGIIDLDNILNAFYLLYDTVIEGWTEKQWEALMVYEREGTFKKASLILDVHASNVFKFCERASWKEISKAEDLMKKIIEQSLFRYD